MTLDEYREQLIVRLKSCRDAAAARALVADAYLRLKQTHLTVPTQSRFWESVHEELEQTVQDPTRADDRDGGMRLAAVRAAQARISRYRDRLSDHSSTPH